MVSASAIAEDKPSANKTLAFIGAKIIPIVGDEIPKGTLIISGDKIVAVGAMDQVAVPDNAERIDVVGRVLMPGLVDTHNHIGGIGGADTSAPIQPDIRIYDSLNPLDAGFKRALAGGLTTLNIMPGSGHLLSGQTVYVKVRKADVIEDMFIRDADGRPTGGMKMANGTNSRSDAPFPGSRAKSVSLVREKYVKAQEYREKIAKAAGDVNKMPARDIGLDGLLEVLDGKRVVHHHTHRADDIMSVIRIAQEFKFRVVLHHVSEAWQVADEIAKANVPCSVIVIDSPGGKLEASQMSLETGAVLERAGVLVAFHTDDWITDSRVFMRSAALAVRAGMTRAGALKALTINGAKMLDLQGRVGSLEPGKDADFVILDGDPLSVYGHVMQTWVEGKKMFDRTDPKDYLYAVGGFGAGNEQVPYFCCFDGEGGR
ncbi:MAG: amidohydrolase family protein [Planctomycetes bacterium]|nr:amidohydrolase family protein [Planctomycetota bacterium]MBI3835806.1 amidohydrolase family protein [Planctomycetota bacterium]